MERVRLDKDNAEEAAIKAADVIRQGGVVVFPAESLYGLAADAASDEAVTRVFELKGRPPGHPLPIIAADTGMAERHAVMNEAAKALAEKFWPGPLTMVMPAKGGISRLVTGVLDTVGIRVPASDIARKLAENLGAPITATSANKSGDEGASTADEAVAGLSGEPDLVLDGGGLSGPPGSTIIKIEGDGFSVLRHGLVKEEELEQALKGPLLK